MRAAALISGGMRKLLQSFDYVAGANAACASFNSHDAAIFHGSDLLKVWIPNGTGLIVSVAHVVTEAGPFSTNITFSGHIIFPPSNY